MGRPISIPGSRARFASMAAFLKTLTFACVHSTVAFTVAYALTDSIMVGSLIALIEPICNTVAFYFHEKAWEWLANGRPINQLP